MPDVRCSLWLFASGLLPFICCGDAGHSQYCAKTLFATLVMLKTNDVGVSALLPFWIGFSSQTTSVAFGAAWRQQELGGQHFCSKPKVHNPPLGDFPLNEQQQVSV
jgi:hypothetical protein